MRSGRFRAVSPQAVSEEHFSFMAAAAEATASSPWAAAVADEAGVSVRSLAQAMETVNAAGSAFSSAIPTGKEGDVPRQLRLVREALEEGTAAAFATHVLAFVNAWQAERDQMETNEIFVDDELMKSLAAAISDPELSWYALKLGCLMARADANSLSLLRAGGVGAVLETLKADWPD